MCFATLVVVSEYLQRGSTVAMIIYWITLSILIHWASRRYSPQQVKDTEEYTSNGFLRWMLQAVRETGLGEVGLKDLHEWSFEWHGDRQRTGLIRKGGAGAYFGYEAVQLSPPVSPDHFCTGRI